MPFNPFLAPGRFSGSTVSSGSGSGGGSDLAPNKVQFAPTNMPRGTAGRYGSAVRINDGFRIGPATQANQIFQCPGYRIPVGAKFTLLAPNTNGGIALASETREKLLTGEADIVPDITPIDYPVDNTARVWVLLAAVGDYVNVRITDQG